MSRRLPAPPPPGAPPPEPPKEEEVPRPEPSIDDELDEDWDDFSEHDDPLLTPDAWPDDIDEPTIPDGVLDEMTNIDDLPDLSAPQDDEEEVDDTLHLEDLPLEDDLTDLTAPDDIELPVLPWTLEILVDGATTPTRVDPGADRTVWWLPEADATEAGVTLRIGDVVVELAVLVREGEGPSIVLGRDVLTGRFLLRP